MTEKRNLILSTEWISTSLNAEDYFNTTISNSIGTITNNRYTNTWNNINLRQLMGDTYYNTYSKFGIKINTAVSNNLLTTNLANSYNKSNNYCIDHYLSGLPFDPSVNQVLFASGTNATQPTTAGTSLGFGLGPYSPTNPEYIFSKPAQDTVNLTINIVSTNTQQPIVPLTSAEIIGHSLYVFEIKGIL
jgi:hypothetical protein